MMYILQILFVFTVDNLQKSGNNKRMAPFPFWILLVSLVYATF